MDVEALLAQVRQIVREECGQGQTLPVSHLVLVADDRAEYWQRISYYYGKAKQAYTPIRFAAPHTYTGELPALVAYSKGTPVKSWLGSREVEDALNRIARGDAGDLLGGITL